MKIHILKNGIKKGPFTVEQAQGMIAAGQLTANDKVHHDGLSDWIAADQSPALRDLLTMASIDTTIKKNYAMGAVAGPFFRWVIVQFCISYWLRTRIEPDQIAGWFRGAVDGGPSALIRWAISFFNGKVYAFYHGHTSMGYKTFFWINCVLLVVNVLYLINKTMAVKKQYE